MEDPSIALILMALCAGLGLFGLVAVGLLVAVIRVFRRGRQVRAEAGAALRQEDPAYLAETLSRLLPWEPEALSDVSSHLETTGRAAFGKLHYRGTLKSLSQPGAPGRLVFNMQLTRAKGPLLLQTPAHALRLDFGGLGSSDVTITLNESPLGSLKLQGSQVTLLDPAGQAAGQYDRQFQAVRVVLSPAGRRDLDLTSRYGAITLHGRDVAQLNSNLIFNFYVESSQGRPVPPLFQNLSPNLSPQDEPWLLALVGWEIVQRITLHINS